MSAGTTRMLGSVHRWRALNRHLVTWHTMVDT
jgi:hypothetical protein